MHRAHLAQNLFDLSRAHDVLVCAQKLIALLADGLLEIHEDLGPVGILAQLRLRPIQIRPQRVIADFFDLIRDAVEVRDDDFVHIGFPS